MTGVAMRQGGGGVGVRWRSLDISSTFFCLLHHLGKLPVCVQYLQMASWVLPESLAHVLKMSRDLYNPQKTSSPLCFLVTNTSRQNFFSDPYLALTYVNVYAHVCPWNVPCLMTQWLSCNSVMSKLVWICSRKCGKMTPKIGVAGCGGDTEENMALESYSFHPGVGRCSFGEEII